MQTNTNESKQLASALSVMLADSYTLMLQTQNAHWNVTGPHFSSLHKLFEEQYNGLFASVDEIAETIRVLGERSPGSYQEFSKLTTVTESTMEGTNWEGMLKQLITVTEKTHESSTKVMELAQDAGNETVADLAITHMEMLEKNAWMMRSSLA